MGRQFSTQLVSAGRERADCEHPSLPQQRPIKSLSLGDSGIQ